MRRDVGAILYGCPPEYENHNITKGNHKSYPYNRDRRLIE